MRALSNCRELAAFLVMLLAVLSDSSSPMRSGERARDNLAGSLGGLRRVDLRACLFASQLPSCCIKAHSLRGAVNFVSLVGDDTEALLNWYDPVRIVNGHSASDPQLA